MPDKPETGPTITLGNGTVVDVTDPNNVVPVYADMVTEIRVVNDIVHLSLAALTTDGQTTITGEAKVCVRVRMPLATIKMIQETLENKAQPIHDGTQAVN